MQPSFKGVLVVAAVTTILMLTDRISWPSAPAPPPNVAEARTAAKPPGDANAGKALFAAKGCVACHVAPGVPGAVGTIGPSLSGIGDTTKRAMLADGAQNTPANLSAWVKDPQARKPGSLMPNLGLTQKEADDLTSFLMTLR